MAKIVIGDYHIQLTPEETTKYSKLTEDSVKLDCTKEQAEVALRGQPDGLSHEDYYVTLKLLLQLGASDEAIAPWVRLLPVDYKEVLSKDQKLDLWSRTTDVPVPLSELREQAAWRDIIKLVETLLGSPVHNKLYLWHLVQKRSSGMSSARYYGNISKNARSDADVDKNGLFSYEVKERRGTMVDGFEEVFRLLSSDKHKLLPPSLLTREVEELPEDELITELQRLSSLSGLPHQQPFVHRLLGLYVKVSGVKSRVYSKMEWTVHEDTPSAMTGLLLYVCLLLLRTMPGKSMLTSLENFVETRAVSLKRKSKGTDKSVEEVLLKSKSISGSTNTEFLRVALNDSTVMRYLSEMVWCMRFGNLCKLAYACGLPPLDPK